jgi:hypothetical protein
VFAPNPGAVERFEVSYEGRATAYRYELLAPQLP